MAPEEVEERAELTAEVGDPLYLLGGTRDAEGEPDEDGEPDVALGEPMADNADESVDVVGDE
jgi:hypothetical protein